MKPLSPTVWHTAEHSFAVYFLNKQEITVSRIFRSSHQWQVVWVCEEERAATAQQQAWRPCNPRRSTWKKQPRPILGTLNTFLLEEVFFYYVNVNDVFYYLLINKWKLIIMNQSQFSLMVQETDDWWFPKKHCHSRRKGETIFHLIWVNAIDAKWKLNLIITHPIALIIIGIKCAVSFQKSRKNTFDFETHFSNNYVQPSVHFFFWHKLFFFMSMSHSFLLNAETRTSLKPVLCFHFNIVHSFWREQYGIGTTKKNIVVGKKKGKYIGKDT